MEACHWWNVGGWDVWITKPVLHRAQMMAHWLHRSMREGYSMEKRLEKMKADAKKKGGKDSKDDDRNDFHRLDSILAALEHGKKVSPSIEVKHGGRKG